MSGLSPRQESPLQEPSDAISQLVQQISAAEIACVSMEESPRQGLQIDRQISTSHSPLSSSRSKSPLFTTKYKQGMLKNLKQQKAAILEGRALWSAIKQRKESEERVNVMKNRIRKLEADQDKLNRSLILVSSKSQKLLECRKYHQERLKEQEKMKEIEESKRLEKTEKFMRDRIQRIQKRELNRKKFLNQNKVRAENIKKSISEGLQSTKKLEQQKLVKKKTKQVKEKLERSMLVGLLSARDAEKDKLRDRLEKEREDAHVNAQKLKELEEKEQNLMSSLQKTARYSQEVLSRAKATSYLYPYYKKLPLTANKKRKEDVADMERTTTGSSRKNTTGHNRTFDAHK